MLSQAIRKAEIAGHQAETPERPPRICAGSCVSAD